MFSAPGTTRELPRPISDDERPGQEALKVLALVLQECLDAGNASSADPYLLTLCLWTAMHGMITLRQARPYFPWPPTEQLIDTLLVNCIGTPGADR
jgi:hypothetical protein